MIAHWIIPGIGALVLSGLWLLGNVIAGPKPHWLRGGR
jgi:hypothetical protein